jgi:hypothetical protein
VSGVSRNRGDFVKCVAIQKRLGIPALRGENRGYNIQTTAYLFKKTLNAGYSENQIKLINILSGLNY